MAKREPRSLFQRLTRLFRSGPVVKRKIRGLDTTVVQADKTKSSGHMLFQKSLSPTYATITSNAYNLSERLMRYQDFQEMEYCLTGDTLIAVPDGYRRIDELATECATDVEKRFIVYAYDHNQRKIVPAWAKQARQTRVDHAWRVTFDSGKQITGSGNHRLMLRDGTYCRIDQLKAGDAMMPFYRKDLFADAEKDTKGYSWVYTMDNRFRGWTKEHQLIAEWVAGRELTEDECVHHINFVKTDNRPENLWIMEKGDHSSLHARINNQHKWSVENAEWIAQFKQRHSEFMRLHNPVERTDITFGRILETCERVGFNIKKLSDALDTDPNVIKRRLRTHGFNDFQTFALAYDRSWRNGGWDNAGEKNPRYDVGLTFEMVCSAFESGMSAKQLATKLGTTDTKIVNRIKAAGYKNWMNFSQTYQNHKVMSVEYVGVVPLYDLTVDGYKNFATDSVVSHNTPEIAAALDIYADETCAQDDKGRVLHIFSDNEKIKEVIEDLFYNTLNVEFQLRSWVRNLCKYGDFFLYNDVSPEYGVVNAFPIPVNEIEREENFDRDDPFAVRYRWVTLGNRTLENWEVTHFRLLGNDMFLPYGSSIIEPARRIWRQLILIEDAMLVYRVVRAPERRVFYIDVANVPPENVPMYVEEQRRNLRTNQVIDRQSGRVDLRYNPLSVDEDYFIPVRGGDTGTKIDTLAGGQNTAAVEDVAYIQKKLFAALKIPRAYLGYDELLSSKATLAQEDIRFSRTINVIQKTILAELNKLAIIHLYAHGYDSDDLQNFTLRLSNPSTVAQQQKLELWRAKFEIAGSLPEGMGSKQFVATEIWGLSKDEFDAFTKQRMNEKLTDATIEAATPEGGGAEAGGGGGEDLFGGGEEEVGGEAGGEETPPGEENAGEEPEEEQQPNVELLMSQDNQDDDESFGLKMSLTDNDKPVKVQPQLKKALYNQGRKRTHGASKTHMPDFNKMTSTDNRAMKDPHDSDWMKAVVSNPFGEGKMQPATLRLAPDLASTLKRMSSTLKLDGRDAGLISEGIDVQDEIDENLQHGETTEAPPGDVNEVLIIDDEDEGEDT